VSYPGFAVCPVACMYMENFDFVSHYWIVGDTLKLLSRFLGYGRTYIGEMTGEDVMHNLSYARIDQAQVADGVQRQMGENRVKQLIWEFQQGSRIVSSHFLGYTELYEVFEMNLK